VSVEPSTELNELRGRFSAKKHFAGNDLGELPTVEKIVEQMHRLDPTGRLPGALWQHRFMFWETTMRRAFITKILGAAVALPVCAAAQMSPTPAASCPALLQHTAARLQDGQPQALCQYSGKVLLVVNTASQCGYTPQYTGLEALHAQYAAKGLVIMGFPSNDFGQQEPGNAKKIAETCFNFYGVRFPMFSKIKTIGADAHPLYSSLAQATGQPPKWNFHKYLVDRQGKVIASFASDVPPQDKRIVGEVEKLLAQR
jgi:glutathione peroxidase